MKSFNYAVISSLCALIIGVLLIVWPDVAVNYLVITVGVLFLLPGLLGLFSYFASAGRRREAGIRQAFPVIALGSSLFGLWLMIMPEFFIGILMYVLGVLLVLGGISQLVNFASARAYIHVPAGVYVLPSAILVTGIVVLFNPFQAATVPFIVLGAASVVYALTDLFRLLRFRRKRNGQIEDITPIEETKEE